MITWQEKDIEDYVCENVEEVFGENYHFIGRQIDIGVGIIDLLLYNETSSELVVVEIKNKPVCNNALTQIMRYVRGIMDYWLAKEEFLGSKVLGVKGYLLGPEINDETKSSLRFIQETISFHEIVVSIQVEVNEANYSRNEKSSSYKPETFISLVDEKISEIVEYSLGPEEGEDDG